MNKSVTFDEDTIARTRPCDRAELCLTQDDDQPLRLRDLKNILPIAYETFSEMFDSIHIDTEENKKITEQDKVFNPDESLLLSHPIATDYFNILLHSMNIYKASSASDQILILANDHEHEVQWRDLKVSRSALRSFLSTD